MSKQEETKSEETVCVWHLGDPCEGETSKELMFRKQLEIPICKNHLEGHKHIMVLHGNGYEIEEVVDMTCEQRAKIVYTLQLSGLDLSKVEL